MPARRTRLQTDEQRLHRQDALFDRHVANALDAVGGWKLPIRPLGTSSSGTTSSSRARVGGSRIPHGYFIESDAAGNIVRSTPPPAGR